MTATLDYSLLTSNGTQALMLQSQIIIKRNPQVFQTVKPVHQQTPTTTVRNCTFAIVSFSKERKTQPFKAPKECPGGSYQMNGKHFPNRKDSMQEVLQQFYIFREKL